MEWNIRKFAALALCGALIPAQVPAQPAPPPAPARTTVFISDMHMGVGKGSDGKWLAKEDFRWPKALDGFLSYLDRTYDGQVDLVILGDFLELWQPFPGMTCTDPEAETSCTIQETAALAEYVARAHAADLERLGDFSRQHDNRVQIVPGNHDAALNEPAVWSKVAPAFGKDARVDFVGAGVWVSSSGLTVAEHGHQIGEDVNSYPRWPRVENPRYPDHLQRPWGQLFVQKVYNDVEDEYPVIDNINPEAVGVKYRIADRGLAASASDLARFLRFNLFETSKSQLAKFLSTPDNKPHWNVALGKAAGHRLVLESLPPGDELAILIQEDSAEGRDLRAALDEQVAAMPRSGILQLCELAAMLDRHPCEPSVASYAAQSRMRTEEQIITPHLGMRGGSYPSMINFVYGHTHSFQAPWTAKLNGANVSVANTGAFHRVVDEAGFESRAAGRPRSEALRSLTPEDLPACYTYVLVQDEHAPMSLLRWYQPEGAAGFAVDAGDSRCR